MPYLSVKSQLIATVVNADFHFHVLDAFCHLIWE